MKAIDRNGEVTKYAKRPKSYSRKEDEAMIEMRKSNLATLFEKNPVPEKPESATRLIKNGNYLTDTLLR